jgi:hypothetical protein
LPPLMILEGPNLSHYPRRVGGVGLHSRTNFSTLNLVPTGWMWFAGLEFLTTS